MVALAAALALLTGDVRLEGQASARLETRARTATGNDLTDTAAGDAEVTPSLSGSLENLGGRISLSYSPTLRVREPYFQTQIDQDTGVARGRRTEFNNRQSLELQWSREGRPRPYLLETFYQGRSDLAVQRGTTAPTFQLGQISEATVDVNGGVQWPLSRLLSLDTSAGFNYSTGTDSRSIAVLPEQQAWRTRAVFDATLSGLDRLYGQFDAQHSRFPGLQTTATVGSAAVRWRHQVLRPTSFELGALMGVVYGTWGDQPAAIAPTPGGDAALMNRFDLGANVVVFDLGLRVAPAIDRYVAAAFSRGEVFANLGWTYQERWALAGRAGLARSLTAVRLRGTGDDQQIFTTFAELRAGYIAPRYWRVDVSGINSTFVLLGNPNANIVNNWMVSLSLTLHAEGQL